MSEANVTEVSGMVEWVWRGGANLSASDGVTVNQSLVARSLTGGRIFDVNRQRHG